ncbi:cellulose synthase subunit BcsC-related outer membrane protein [Psychromonas aquimarina]|uniref:cellulose synthase subunit BcsC-related outer membrane protein n=1 Tax=Psychromonas aquimarina TaxID=444919 RepID=UPI0003FDBFB1|nr:cellulose synthase subunit BcsC-related outer membrane protein [Psychromonas aquimarina]
MSIKVDSITRLILLVLGALLLSGTPLVYALQYPPLTKQQRAQVYNVEQAAVSFNSSLEQVDSVEWLLKQLKLADAMNRDDIVESTLERLFAIEADNLDGLYYQTNMYLKRRESDKAAQATETLNRLAPNAEQTLAVNDLLASRGKNKSAFQQARLLARAGRYQEALQAYKKVFPNGMPTSALQLEYLQVEGNMNRRWQTVKLGLERLNAQYPGVPQYQLALANHIRKKDPSDKWILAVYRQLSLRPDIGSAAASSWLRALDQLPISQSVADQYAVLAGYYPADLEIQRANQSAQKRLAVEIELRKDPTYLAKLSGLALLEQGRNTQAEKQLRYALTTRPNDAQILGGMGTIYLRKGEQSKALEYFKQAQKIDKDPDNASKWQSLVNASSYWAYLDQGDTQLENSRYSQAEKFYNKAVSVDKRSPYAYNKLAYLHLVQQDYEHADQIYRTALKYEPLNASALSGRLDVKLFQQGLDGALRLADSYSAKQQKAAADKITAMKVQSILLHLHDSIVRADDSAVRLYAEQLLDLNPDSPWQRADIADALQSIGEQDKADQLMLQWSEQSTDPEMLFAYSLYLSRTERLEPAVVTLNRIPEQQRTPAMSSNLIRLTLDKQLQNIEAGYSADPQQAGAQLEKLTLQYADDPQASARLASSWFDVGEIERANTIYLSMQPSDDWPFSSRLAYGNLMVKLGLFSEFDQWAAETKDRAAGQPLSSAELTALDELTIRRDLAQADFAMRQSDWELADNLYRQAAKEKEPYQTQGQIGALSASVHSGSSQQQQELSVILYYKQHKLTARQLMQTAALFNQLGFEQQANALNVLLASKPDADELDYRDSMALAMDNQQWQLAENRAYQALNADRIAKSDDRGAAMVETPALRTLYNNADDYWLTRNVKSDIDTLHDRRDGHVIIGFDYSSHDGQNQTSQVPVEARIPFEELQGHLLLRADTVNIRSGDLSYYDKENAADSGVPLDEHAVGTALGVGWQAESWSADIGSTPLGFDHSTWVGGFTVNGKLQDFGWSAAISRRPETSSILSYSGLTVPGSIGGDTQGDQWGGVVRAGVKLGASHDLGGPVGFWSSLQYHQLSGVNVEDNTRLGLLGGGYYKLTAADDERLSVGMNLMYLGYEKNLGEYTYGHGAYYSPQSYFSVSLPVNYYARYGNTWSYALSGSLSNSWSKEDAPYLSTGEAGDGGGFGYSFQAAVEKRVNKRWYLGASLDLQRSEFYEPDHFMVYLKYTFSDRWQPIQIPPGTLRLYSDFD